MRSCALAAVRYGDDPALPSPSAYGELYPLITHRTQSGHAHSVDAAQKQLAREGLIPGSGTDENRAHRLASLYRAKFCIPASSFSQIRKNQDTEEQKDTNLKSCQGSGRLQGYSMMTSQANKALAPDKMKRVIPRHFLINLRTQEGMSDALPAECFSASFLAGRHRQNRLRRRCHAHPSQRPGNGYPNRCASSGRRVLRA